MKILLIILLLYCLNVFSQTHEERAKTFYDKYQSASSDSIRFDSYGKYNYYVSYYDNSDVEVVRKLFKDDIETFGYSFDKR